MNDDIDTTNAIQESDRPGRSLWRILLIVLAIISGLILAALIALYLTQRADRSRIAFETASSQAIAASEMLEQDFAQTSALTEAIAEDLSTGALTYEDLEQRLRAELDANPALDGITVAFEPFAFSPDFELYIVYVSRDQSAGLVSQVGESRYDYTLPPSDDPQAPQTAWYNNPIINGPTWTEPFLAAGVGRVLIEYGVPFTAVNAADRAPIGVVAADYSLDGMRQLVAELDLGLTGYGAVYAESGTFLSHPVPEKIAEGNIFTDETLQDERFQDAAQRALDGQTLSVQRELQDQSVWNFFTPIGDLGWALVVQLSQAEFFLEGDTLLYNQVAIVLAAGAFLFFLLAVLLHFDEGTRDRLWLASITFSVIGVLMIVAVVVLERRTPADFGNGILITNQASLKRYEQGLNAQYRERGLSELIDVPTGVLIQSAHFSDPSVVALNGYFWQLIPTDEDLEITPGVSFPQLIDEPMSVEQVYVEERETDNLIISTFTVALRQTFDPIRYPLDLYDINMRMVPLEFAANTLLVPDLESYNVTAPSALPGLDDTVRINNWRLRASAFSLGFRRYGTNMGIPQRATVDVPELSFNIRVERRFLGPFIAFFLPALVATIMIFGFLLNDHQPDEPEEIVTALSYTAALFFVVAVLHATLRDNAAAIGLTYLEYFYLLLYVLTLLVALNSFLVVRFPYLPLVSYGNNLIAKLLFWPTVVGFMLIVTLYVFILGP